MKRDWTSRSTILLIGLILVVVNLIGLNLFGRVDLTDDGVYSLSGASIRLVEQLDDPVTVTAFFTDNLPAPYSANRRFLKDKLDDYAAYGGQQFQYRFVDPAGDADLQAEAARFGIPPVQIQVIESDNFSSKNAYMGVAISYGGEREVVPIVQDLSTLEYDLTSAIRRLTRDSVPVVGFLTGHGEPELASSMPSLQRDLSRNYTVETTRIVAGELESRPEALVVMAPSDSLSESDQKALDAYIMSGGRIAFLLNQVSADLQNGTATGSSVDLERMLATYGIGIGNDLVMDRQSSAITVQQQQGFFNVARQIEYPFFPILNNFNRDHTMVTGLRQMLLYYASSIDTSAALPQGVIREPLAYTSNQAGRQQGFYMIRPGMEQAGLTEGPFLLAAAYTGTFPSAFDAGRVGVSSRIVVVGDGDFLNEQIVGAIPGNVEFGLNLVDWLVQDDALLAIRSKKIEPRALASVSDGLRPWIKYGVMFGPVLLVILFGLLRWRRRKGRQIILVK